MATITYTNFLALNLSLDIILDPGGTIGTHDATTFEIINAVPGGPAENFVFQITGTGFTYTGTTPTGGTITGVTVFDGSSNTIATVAGALGNTSLATFWTNLQGSGRQLAALDNFLSLSDTMNGSDSSDRLTTYGNVDGNFDTLLGGAGNDILRQRGPVGDPVLVGGTGDDIFRIDGTGLPASTFVTVHGSASDGSGGAGENDVVEIRGQFIRFSSITNIDGLRFAQVVPPPIVDLGRIVTFTPDQIAIGQVSPTLAVEGFGGAGGDILRITQVGSTPISLDLSGWSFTSWASANQVVEITINGQVVGTPVFDSILLGSGDDTADGGMGNDIINASSGNDDLDGGSGDDTLNGEIGNDDLDGGPGNDMLAGGEDSDQLFSRLGEGPSAGTETLDGGDGSDFALIDRSDQTRSFNLDLGDPTIATNVGDGTSIVRVERIEFRAGSGNDSLTGGLLDDILIGNAGRDLLSGNAGNDNLQGGNGIDTLSGDAGNDNLDGGAGNDNLDGGDGDDTLTGGAGFDTLDGGSNTDSAVFSGPRAAYSITTLGNDFQITGPDGTDFLTNIEFAAFADTTIALAPDNTFTGTPGNDSFTARPGNTRIDALGGVDTVTFSFRLVEATITFSGNQVIVDSASSHTVLTGFEIYVFADGVADNNDSDALVDDLFYASRYHDVWNAHVDADQHYHQHGWREVRDPSAFFDTGFYLAIYPDVGAAGIDPLVHFDQAGWRAGRVPAVTFDPARYQAANPDVAAAGVDPLLHFLLHGAQEGRQPFALTELLAPNGFDYVYYLQNNPDVAAAGIDPLRHFETHGWREGRNPNALFDTAGYLATYTDVAAANVNPLDHYAASGWHEGRDPSVNFDTTSYLVAYPDVDAANVNPLAHFLDFGIHEGRSPFADGVWG